VHQLAGGTPTAGVGSLGVAVAEGGVMGGQDVTGPHVGALAGGQPVGYGFALNRFQQPLRVKCQAICCTNRRERETWSYYVALHSRASTQQML